jgi:hypothetical protein
MAVSTIQRLTADILAARVLLSMLGKDRTAPVAQRQYIHGAAFEIYDPRRTRKTVLLIHGLVLAGENDPRLVRFARALASSGLRVIVPILAGLKAYRFDLADLDTLVEIATNIQAQSQAPLAVVAFSAGASLSLTASAIPSGYNLFDPLVLFSPLYDLETVWKVFHTQRKVPPEGTQAWDDYVWVQCVIAYRNRSTLRLSPDTQNRLEDVLRRYSVGMPTPEKAAFYETLIKPLELTNPAALFHEGEALAYLSPRGKLAGLQNRVILLQSPADTLLPADEIQALYTELSHRQTGQTRLLNTPLLAHANVGSSRHIQDAFHLIHLLGELFL